MIKDNIINRKARELRALYKWSKNYADEEMGICKSINIKCQHARHSKWMRYYSVMMRGSPNIKFFAKRDPEGREYLNLGTIYRLYESSGVIPCVPMPIEHLEDVGITIMEFISGRNLRWLLYLNLLWPLRIFRSTYLAKCLKDTGQWLAQYHALTGLDNVNYVISQDMTKEYLHRIDNLRDTNQTDPRTQGEPNVLAAEFAPRNIFITPKGIVVYDWTKLCNTSPFMVLHYFCANLRAFCRRLFCPPGLTTELQAVFIRSYFKHVNLPLKTVDFVAYEQNYMALSTTDSSEFAWDLSGVRKEAVKYLANPRIRDKRQYAKAVVKLL